MSAAPQREPPVRITPLPDRLDSWKEIAAYLNRGTRTVQRWEKTEELPVHRHLHEKQGTVFGYRSELDAWWAGRRAALEAAPATPMLAPVRAAVEGPRRAYLITAAAMIVTAIGALIAWRSLAPQPEIRAGRPIPFATSPNFEVQPAFSPDGRYIAFASINAHDTESDIYIQPVDKGEPVRLTDHPAIELLPCWSPDGESIAFLRFGEDHNVTLVVKPAHGGSERVVGALTRSPVPGPLLDWSHDARWLIVSSRSAYGEPARLFRLALATGEMRPITTPCTGCIGDGSIALSADRRRLAFLRSQRTGGRDIYVVDLDSDALPAGEPSRVTNHNALVGSPVWLPGARDLAYVKIADFNWTWLRTSAAGGPERPFEAFAGFPPYLALSRDGRRAAYGLASFDLNIRAADVAGGLERAAIVSTRVDANPHISPDGASVVFSSDRRGNMEIWKSAPDGSNAVQLTSFPGTSAGTPRWSPDGREVAFDVSDPDNADIYVMAADGARVRRLTAEPSRDFVPAWSNDGKSIYFGSDRSGDHQIWKVPASGGPAVQVTRRGGYGAQEIPGATHLIVTKHAGKDKNLLGAWRVSLADGSEEQIVHEPVDWSRVVVAATGVYYVAHDPADESTVLRFHDFAAASAKTLRKLEGRVTLGFAVSPDRTWFVYTTPEQRTSDLMLVDLR